MSYHPGPWYVDEAGVVAEGWGLIASLGAPEAYENAEALPEDIQAKVAEHATLIAAAPDLLEALKGAVQALRNPNKLGPAGYLAAAQLAIDRAEGAMTVVFTPE